MSDNFCLSVCVLIDVNEQLTDFPKNRIDDQERVQASKASLKERRMALRLVVLIVVAVIGGRFWIEDGSVSAKTDRQKEK